jgi:ABC-type lipoprotein release transport system permease subunit
MLFATRPYDPVTFATVTAALLLTSLAASIVPAYRAARLDPMNTLKQQ